MIEYNLELADIESHQRLEKIIRNHYEIMETVNNDSEEAVGGGACMYYKVKIKLVEKWG